MSLVNSARIRSFFLRSICILAYTTVVFGLFSLGIAQDQDGAGSNQTTVAATSEQESDLPQHAIWRFGDYGKTSDANGIYRLQFSRDGKLLATRNRKNIVSIFDVATRKRLCEIDGYENNWVESIDFSPDGKFFVTAAGSSEKVKVWNSQTGKLKSEIDTDAIAAYFNDSGTLIHVLGETHVESYSWPGVQMTTQQKWKNQNETRVGMSRDGRIVVTYRTLPRQRYQTQVIDLENKSKIQLDGPTGIPKFVDISPNRLWVATAYHRDEKIRLWDLRDPHEKKYTLQGHQETVQSLSFSEDNRFLVSSGWDEKVIAWDLLTRQSIGVFEGHSEHVNATAFAPLDLTFASGASGTTDTSTIVWNLKDFLLATGPFPNPLDFDQVWTNLGANTLKISLDATNRLIQGGDKYLDLVDRKIGSIASPESMGSFESTIKLLEHPEWAVREKATELLLKIRDKMDAELRRALEEATSPEVRFRISKVLKKKVSRPKTDVVEVRRWNRIIFALEQINSERTQAILNKIAAANPDVDISQDAKAAFDRNVMRKQLAE